MSLRDVAIEAARRVVRRTWMKAAMRGVSRGDAHAQLDRAYLVHDPWQLDSPPERARFAETNRVLRSRFGRAQTLLEVGCGEGVQSETLMQVCDRLTGIDVSSRAVARAQARLPACQFVVGDLLSMPWVSEPHRYDVVVACEVLYYIHDVNATLAAMTRLGRGRLVTYFEPAERRIGHMVRSMPGVEIATITHDTTRWVVATW